MKKNNRLMSCFSACGMLVMIMFCSCTLGTAQNVPDPALLAGEHPSPPIVRGFMMKEKSPQKDYNDARAWGADVIRLQLHPVRYAMNNHEAFWQAWPSYMAQMVGEVKKAKQAGLKVVIDLHEPPFQNTGSGKADFWRQFQDAAFWNRPDLSKAFCRAWTDIARRLLPYKKVIWGYDLYNEPVDHGQKGAPRQWRPLAIRILHAIRKVDPDTWIIFEPGLWGNFEGFKDLTPLPDPHVIYSAHFYDPHRFTHQGVNIPEGTSLADAMKQVDISYPGVISGVKWDKEKLKEVLQYADEFQKKWHVPIFVGEFSVIRWAPGKSSVQWLKDVVSLFESRGWSWCYHAFREFQGWSLEYDNKFWMQGMPIPEPVTYETDRAKVIKAALKNNWK